MHWMPFCFGLFLREVVVAVVRYDVLRILLTQLLLHLLVVMCVFSYWVPFTGQVTSALYLINVVHRFVQT